MSLLVCKVGVISKFVIMRFAIRYSNPLRPRHMPYPRSYVWVKARVKPVAYLSLSYLVFRGRLPVFPLFFCTLMDNNHYQLSLSFCLEIQDKVLPDKTSLARQDKLPLFDCSHNIPQSSNLLIFHKIK